MARVRRGGAPFFTVPFLEGVVSLSVRGTFDETAGALLASPIPERLRILDLGSGQGDFLAEARRRFPEAELAGLDASQAGLDRRQAGYESLGVQGVGFPSFNLYKLAVCLRGGRIAQDVEQPQGISRATALAMAAFAPLFRLNRNRWGPGWQTFGVFRAR